LNFTFFYNIYPINKIILFKEHFISAQILLYQHVKYFLQPYRRKRGK
jgi:hypothetical protein